MGQGEIYKILQGLYPSYLTATQISKISKVGKFSTLRCLRAMRKRDEIELKIVRGNKVRAGWLYFYRAK